MAPAASTPTKPAEPPGPPLRESGAATPGAVAAASPARRNEVTEPGAAVTGHPGNGVTVDAGDAFSLNLKARIQIRYQLAIPHEDDKGNRKLEQTVNIATTRLYLSGHMYNRNLTYMLQLAFGGRDYRDGTTSPIYDASLDLAAHRDLKVRVGQYYVPFDRLRTMRDWALQIADRPRPVTELALDRDVGATFYSDTFLGDASPVAYRLGAFGGAGTNLLTGKKPGALLVGRLELRPLGPVDDDIEGDLERKPKPRLALGGAVAGNWNTSRARSTTGPTFVGGTTDYRHAAVDLVFKWFGFALEAEHLWRAASRNRIESVDENGGPLTEYTRSGRAWILQASYVFDPPLEIVGRLSRLHTYAGTDPKFQTDVEAGGQEVGAGLNYYFNGHKLKLQADWMAVMPTNFEMHRADHLVHVVLDATL